MRITVANKKGGVTKTTSSIYLATALSEDGDTLLVDADPQQSALKWVGDAERYGHEVPFTVIALATKDLHRRLVRAAKPFKHVIVDTPPGDIPILKSALKAADIALIPVTPSVVDLNQMDETIDLIADAEEENEDLKYVVLLSRVKRISNAGKESRAALEGARHPVLATEVPDLNVYTDIEAVFDSLGEYGAVTRELLSIAGESPSRNGGRRG